MAYKKLFVDSDIIIDLLSERELFYEFAEGLFAECFKRQIACETSVLIVANVRHFLSKKFGKEDVKVRIKMLLEMVNVLAFDKQAIDFAVNSNFNDFEDAIQHFIAKENNCDLIITRNIKDYKHATIPVLTAEQFLRTIL